MEVCGLTRILLPSAVVGVIVATVTMNEPVGWAAALITGVIVFVAMRANGDQGACAAPDPERIDGPVSVGETPEPALTLDELLDTRSTTADDPGRFAEH